jgi:tol-pal system protein YbgF
LLFGDWRRNFASLASEIFAMSPIQTRTFLMASAAVLALGLAAPAMAQKTLELPQLAVPDPADSERLDNKRVEGRLQREEKALRELRQIVLQAKAQGNPVTVKDAGPDPDVQALQQRVNDLEETLRKQTGQMEESAHAAQLAAKAAAEANDANKALTARLDSLEKQQQAALAAGAAAPPAAVPPAAVAEGPGVIGTLRGRGPAAAASQDIEADPTVKSGPGDEQAAYRAARQTLDSGDYVGGAQALQAYLDRYPTSPRAPEANYWLGRTLGLRDMQKEAAAAYARALKGWPKSAWAGDAVVRLSATLVELQDNSNACKAVAEFDGRYEKTASTTVKARAKDVRARASCG